VDGSHAKETLLEANNESAGVYFLYYQHLWPIAIMVLCLSKLRAFQGFLQPNQYGGQSRQHAWRDWCNIQKPIVN